MSDTQAAWAVIWEHAEHVNGPFEIASVVPAVAAKIGSTEEQARQVVNMVVSEADRLAEGSQYFRIEGAAIVPQGEFFDAVLNGKTAADAYPFEL